MHKMSETSRDALKTELQRVMQICEMPRLYLADYFMELRNRVDKQIVSKQMQTQIEEKQKELLKLVWTETIEKIELFERKCNNLVNKTKIKDKALADIQDRLNLIEILLEDESARDLREFQLAIQTEEKNLLKYLFQNKTIVLLNSKMFFNRSENKNLFDNKLIIVNDDYISHKAFLNR